VPEAGRSPRWALLLKIALFALLAGNTARYLLLGTLSEALDSLAWLVLLFSFEAETGLRERFGGRGTTVALRGTRLLAAAALVVAAMGYVRGKEWLDAINVGLWIAVVGILEFQVRRPDTARQASRGFAAAAAALYAGLGGLVAAWLLRGEWFDAYDAALWLAAFAILELDLLGRSRYGPGT
jgi:hypothetical protein